VNGPDPRWGPLASRRRGTLLPAEHAGFRGGREEVSQLEENVAIAREFTPLDGPQLAALERKAEPVAAQALWFRRA